MKEKINSENLKYASGGVHKAIIGTIAVFGAMTLICNNLKNDEKNIIDQADTYIGQQFHQKMLDTVFNKNKKNNYEDK